MRTISSAQEDSQNEILASITLDVVFEHISLPLLEQQIINSEEYYKIRMKSSESEQMTVLLDILKEKDLKYFSKFVDVLETNYDWIAVKLRHNIVDFHKFLFSKPSSLSIGITDEMMKLVQKNHRVADKWTVLAHSLGLSRFVMDIRIKVNLHGESNSMCILYLLQEWVGASSKNATLGNLLQTLREQDFNDIADQLEEKYA